METTQANPEQRDDSAPPVVGTLGQLVQAGRASENPIPVAVVVSVFDDLLAGDADPPGARSPDLDDVLIDKAGVARLDVAADLAAIGGLLTQALDDQVPASARWLLERLQPDAPDAPADAAQLRVWLRDALGQPADRAELVSLVMSVAAPLPVPEPVAGEDAPTAAPAEDPADTADTTDLAERPESAESAADLTASAEDERLHDLETIPPNGVLMAPLLNLKRAGQAQIPTDNIRKRTFPVGPLPDAAAVSAPPGATASPSAGSPEGDTTPDEPAGSDGGDTEDEIDAPFHEGDADATTLTMPVPVRAAATPQVVKPTEVPAATSGPAVPERPSARPKGPESGRNRPVVRHQLRRDHRISVPVAPAARRTARQTRSHDSIMGPSDRGFPWGWLVVIGMVAAAAYYLLFT